MSNKIKAYSLTPTEKGSDSEHWKVSKSKPREIHVAAYDEDGARRHAQIKLCSTPRAVGTQDHKLHCPWISSNLIKCTEHKEHNYNLDKVEILWPILEEGEGVL